MATKNGGIMAARKKTEPKKVEPKAEVFMIGGEEYTLDTVQGDIAVLRDTNGAPHVFARKDVNGL